MKRLKLITLAAGAVLLLGFFPASCCWLVWADIQNTRKGYSHETYEAWRAANPESTLTYQNWKTLKKHELLPGQAKKPNDSVILMPMPMPIPTR